MDLNDSRHQERTLKNLKQIIHITEMRILRWILGIALLDYVANETSRRTLGIALIIDTFVSNH